MIFAEKLLALPAPPARRAENETQMTHDRRGSKTRKKPPLKARMRAFLRAYAELCMIKYPAAKAGIKRREHYRWLEKYPAYRGAFEETRRYVADDLESIAVERAVNGSLEAVRYKGKICGHIRRYNDGLLMFLLRGFLPQKYRVQSQQVSVPHQPPIQPKVEVTFVYPKESSRTRLPD